MTDEKTLVLLRNASDGIHILDTDGNLIEASDSFCSMLGYRRDEMIGMNVSVWDALLDGEELKNIVRDQLSKTVRSQFESRHRRKDGSLFDVEISGFTLELDGQPVLFYSSRDITRRKVIEDSLRESEARFRQMFEGHSAIMLLVDPGTGSIVDANLAAEEFYGYALDRLREMKIDEINTQSKEEIDREMRNAHGQNRNYFVFEHRLKSGTIRTVEVHSSPVNLKGVSLLFSIIHDISERRKAEESFLISASVFENSQDAIIITDQNNLIIDVNPAFTAITGYTRDEVIGKNPKLLNSGRQDKAFYAEMWQILIQKKKWRGEIWNRRKSGEVYAEMISISAICDNEDKLLRYVAVFSDITHLKEHEAELSRVAHYDALTGIPNRLLLADRMKQAIAQTSRDQTLMAVCYLDLDGFKPINDSMGHEAGDVVLVEIAKRIGNTLRGGDTIARLGGDEFVALLLGQDKGEECVATLERLLLAISQPMTVKNKPVTVSASIGVSIYPMDNEDPDTLLRHADQAMYIAKQSGKNRFHIYDPSLDRRARDQHEFLKSIRHALENNQFELHYQPKVNLRTKELVGAEALIRWRHPVRGILPPSEFLRYVENTDLDIEIGEWVTATALAQMNQWRQAGFDIEVSINITGYHLESLQFIEKLKRQLEIYPESQFGKLQIEVLETVALNDINVVREIIGSCRELGVSFALDDFGTGYSSLSYLSRLPVDTLKIDQSFVRDMLEDKGDRAIVQGIIALATAFERQTVAEGIETEAHFQLLLEMGCDLGQGYGIARPMPANELLAWSKSVR
jgi:diguanylate cyclase (GGDEF)-like protein/PAS domain S-box-containing protein